VTDALPDVTEATAGLGAVLKRGAAMGAIGLVIAQSATVIQTIALGRMLGPVEVGVFTAGTVLLGFLVEVTQGALAGALIHRKTDLEDAANTALVVTFGTGLLLGLAALAAAPVIAALFHSPRIGLIAAASSGLIVLHSCATVPDALMQRAFQFQRQMIIAPLVSISFAVVSIGFALLDFGAWAMVIGWYASASTAVVLSWWMARWRPFRGRFSVRIWRDLAQFSLPMLLDGIAERSRQVFEQAAVGRALGTADLGQFRYAYRIATMPSLAVITVCAHVLFPAFARISEDGARFRAAFLRALGWVWFVALPVGALMIVVGQQIVVFMLGEEWRSAGAAAAAMAGVGLGAAITSVTGEAMKGAGRSSMLNWMTGLGVAMGVPLILLALPWGLIAVGVAISVTYLTVGLVSVELARRVVGVSHRDVYDCLGPTTLAGGVALAVVLALEWSVIRPPGTASMPAPAWLIVELVVFGVVYVGALRLISPSWYASLRAVASRAVLAATASVRRTKRPS
jgi:O-antigen/teichoic acid export membrane protein